MVPAKEISIEELEQIFIEYLNGIYEREYKILLEMPDNADKNIFNCGTTLLGERKPSGRRKKLNGKFIVNVSAFLYN